MAVDSSRANNSNLTSNSSNGNNFCVYVTSSLSDNPSLSGGNGDGGSLSAQSYHQHNHHGRPNNTLGCDIDDPNHGLERLCCSVNNINNNSCNNYSAGECISGSVLSIKNRNIDNQSRCDKRNFEDIAPSLQSGDCRRGGGGHGEGGEGELSDCDDVENLSTRHIWHKASEVSERWNDSDTELSNSYNGSGLIMFLESNDRRSRILQKIENDERTGLIRGTAVVGCS